MVYLNSIENLKLSIEIIFFISIFLIFHSYVIFPALLYLISRKKKENEICYEKNSELPNVSILVSAFNEEKVIKNKILSILDSDYPKEKARIFVGSDNSTDNTNIIVQEIADNNSNVELVTFEKRLGKGNVINKLYDISNGDVVIFTDADVFFNKNTIYELVKHFKNDDIGLVDANMLNKGLKKAGISIQESAYISREVKIKYREGLIWGTMMGPFGGCYAIRRSLYNYVPSHYLVDDFFINMKILQQKKRSVNNLKALVYEDISNNIKEEFRRKVRIATGNFQNFFHFLKMLFSRTKGLSYCYISHKVIRWFVPFLIIISLVTNILLWNTHIIYKICLYGQIGLILIPFIDLLLRIIKIHIIILRFVTHFFVMNLALLIGFFKYIKGVKSNVWEPTKRDQE